MTLTIERADDTRTSGVVAGRPRVEGKFISVHGQKFSVRGVTYGTFKPDADGNEFDPATVESDFAAIASWGFNTVRVYTVPPSWMLDLAGDYGLKLMIGLPWAHHLTLPAAARDIRRLEGEVASWVQACAGHPAVLCFAIANEIPAPIVRLQGRRHVEGLLRRLYNVVKRIDRDALVTYVNYPSTEYLDLPFLDLVSFNVYLEDEAKLDAYLARLQNIAGDRPLMMTELGLDSGRHGEEIQASTLGRQIRVAAQRGVAGTIVFAWTDEWYRGGSEIADWDFGLTRRDRSPKAALTSVVEAFDEGPGEEIASWPRISVVVCTYNGARTLRDCLDGLVQVRYPDFEVIVVNDGSTDAVPEIVREYPFRVITTPNQGLSAARNEGMRAATGEIVAYTDDDARPDPDWLKYLAIGFRTTQHVGIGGPNIAPPGDGLIAECVANSPGGPVHVLTSDTDAEHIPGCNMAFRRDALLAIGGFDHRFRTAGDDVDVCWRLQDAGGTLGFHAGAMVWHHRRNSVRTYWKQQVGYGRAEALLAAKWPARYNPSGHLAWTGRLYGKGLTQLAGFLPQRIYHGSWGTAPFQSMYEGTPPTLWSLPQMPEWYLLVAVLAGFVTTGWAWSPLLYVTGPLLATAIALPLWQALLGARKGIYHDDAVAVVGATKLRALTFFMHLMQPPARLRGRVKHGLTPWRSRKTSGFVLPITRVYGAWSGEWRSAETVLAKLERILLDTGSVVRRGGDHDAWDLDQHGGWSAGSRLLLGVEEHGRGVQHFVFKLTPRISGFVLGFAGACVALGALALVSDALVAGIVLLLFGAAVVLKTVIEAGAAQSSILRALKALPNTRGDSISPAAVPGRDYKSKDAIEGSA